MSRKQPECHEKVKLSLTTGSSASRLAKPCCIVMHGAAGRHTSSCPPASPSRRHPPLGNHPYCHIHPGGGHSETIHTVTSTPGGGHLKTIRNVTRGLPRAAHRQQLPPPSGGVVVLFFYPPQKAVRSFVVCNMPLACGNDAQINHGLRSRLTWDGFYFNGSSTCGNRAGVTLCCCFNLIVSQTEILGGFVFFQTQSELTPKAPRCHYLMFVCTGWE